MRHHTKDKGDLATTFIIAHLTANDIYCALPISEHLPFDLIVISPDNKTLKRVQCKYRDLESSGNIKLSMHNSYNYANETHKIAHDLSQFDCYAIFCRTNNTVYYINNFELINQSNFTIRVDYPKNNQLTCNFGIIYENPNRIFMTNDELLLHNNQVLNEYLKENTQNDNGLTTTSRLTKDELIRLLHSERKNIYDIAKEYGVTDTTVRRWCRNFGINKSGYYW